MTNKKDVDSVSVNGENKYLLKIYGIFSNNGDNEQCLKLVAFLKAFQCGFRTTKEWQ